MQKGATGRTIYTKWKCGWFPECNAPCQNPCNNPSHTRKKCAAYGLHELWDCVHGKWGFYYCADGHIKTWEGIHEYNPSGCAGVYLLIYNQDTNQLLFDLNKNNEFNLPWHRRLTYIPDDLHEVATSLLATLFSTNNKNVPLPSIPHRFIFTDASVIYPICLNNEQAAQILFKSGRKWFNRQDVEKTMEVVRLEWVRKEDHHSYGYKAKHEGARLGERPVFALAALVLRWLFEKQGIESKTISRPASPAFSNAPSISGTIMTTTTDTSGYASGTASVFGPGIDDEPEDHVNFDEFIGIGKSLGSDEFLPNEGEGTICEVESNKFLMFNTTTPEDSRDRKNSIIFCYDIEHLDKEIFSTCDIESFDDPFKFIARTLSIKDRTIYLIISTDKCRSVIPIIHNHYCVENIYLYRSTDTDSSLTWSVISEKIRDCYSDINMLYNQLIDDIKSTTEKPLRWDRSMSFFTMLHTQQLESQNSVIQVYNDAPYDEYIVIFHCDDRNISDAYHGSSPFFHSTDTKECLEFIDKQTQYQIFLILSGGIIPSEMRSIFNYQHIYAIYFFPNKELQYPINRRKVSGFFDKIEDLFEQLHKDIQFYREQHIHTSRIDNFSRIIQKQTLISQLNDKQCTFLTYNLFMDILPVVPILEFTLEDITKICDIVFPNQSTQIVHYINQLQNESYDTNNFIQDPKFSQIILRLHQIDKINELFILQKQFIDIEKQVYEPTAISTLDSVYISRIITNNTLKMMQSSIDEYISIGIFVLATKSLLTARTIARKLVDIGLISILFHIEIIKNTRFINIDFDRVLFYPGVVFRLKSIDRAPDDVFYVKLKPADKEFYFIKEELQFEIDVKLSWLTYGNYLYFLNRFKEGEAYFNYLLDKLSSEHFYVSAIHNNMGLLYVKKYEEKEKEDKELYFDKAKMKFNTIFEKVNLINSSSLIRSNVDQSHAELVAVDGPPTFTTIDYTTIIGHIADLHYLKKEYKKAMEFYMEALELSVDKRACRYYQKMILTIKEYLKE